MTILIWLAIGAGIFGILLIGISAHEAIPDVKLRERDIHSLRGMGDPPTKNGFWSER